MQIRAGGVCSTATTFFNTTRLGAVDYVLTK
jgi:hypothetical protein